MKKSNSQKPPKLGIWSEVAYYIFTGIIIVGELLLLLLFGGVIPDKIAYADHDVAASNSLTAFYCTMPFVLILVVSTVFVGYKLCVERRIKLFSKGFGDELADVIWRKKTTVFKVVVFSLVLSFVFMLCAASCRNELSKDNEITKYGMLNRPIETQSLKNAEKMVLEINYTQHKGSRDYYFNVIFEFEDGEYSFGIGNFGSLFEKKAFEDRFSYVLYLKSVFGYSRIEIRGADMIGAYVKDEELSEEEVKLLCRIFETDTTP